MKITDEMLSAALEEFTAHRLHGTFINGPESDRIGVHCVLDAALAAAPTGELALTDEIVEKAARARNKAYVEMPSTLAAPFDYLCAQYKSADIEAMRAALKAINLGNAAAPTEDHLRAVEQAEAKLAAMQARAEAAEARVAELEQRQRDDRMEQIAPSVDAERLRRVMRGPR